MTDLSESDLAKSDLAMSPPRNGLLHARIALASGIGAAGLIGFGVILWIAANWDKLDKFGKFGLVGGAFLLGALAGMARPGLRIPGALVAFCAIGGMFALFGQVYQSGADPWQLFALWAALGLPLALAARHDALWIPWTMVAFTGISLWTGIARNFFDPEMSAILPGWGLAAVLVSAIFVIDRRLAPHGQSQWAARLAALMAISLVSGNAFYDVLTTHSNTQVFWLGIAVLAGALVLAARSRPLELPLMVAVALAIDVLLIAGLCRILFITIAGRPDSGAFFLVFIVSAAILGGTATALLKWVGQRATPAEATAAATTGDARPVRTWPITLLSGFGAVFASIPLMVFFAMFFSDAFRAGPTIYILAVLLAGISVAMLRAANHLSFTQQLGFIGLVAGLMLASGGMLRDLPNNLGATSGVMLVLTTGLAVVIRAGWIRSLLGAAAGIFLVSFFRSQLIGNTLEDLFTQEVYATMLVATCAAALVFALGRSEESAEPGGLFAPYASGFTAASLATLIHSSGRTFLLGGHGVFESTTANKLVLSLENLAPPVLGVLAAGLAAIVLFRSRRDLRTALALAVAIAITIFAAVSPMLGFTVLLLAVCLTTGRTVLALFAAIGALWIIGSFYYWLGWTLEHKGLFLVALGLALALATALARRPGNSPGASLGAPAALRPVVATGLIGLATVATLGIYGAGIREKEAILSSGRVVYLELVPVDPRSLMQGDYMALRFAMPASSSAVENTDKRPLAIASIDDRNFAKVIELTYKTPSLTAGQIVMKTRQGRTGWAVGTDAWFFPEGQGQKFEAAKFGEFRLGPAGDMILVGMADKDLKPIR